MDNEQPEFALQKDNLFQKCIADRSIDNQNWYKQFRNKITKWIRGRKKEDNFRKLGKESHS